MCSIAKEDPHGIVQKYSPRFWIIFDFSGTDLVFRNKKFHGIVPQRYGLHDLISCQKGLDLFYRKRRSPRDSTRSTARGVLLLGWDKDMPLITRNY